MKTIQFSSWPVLLLACVVAQSSSAQQTEGQATIRSTPPTGTYALHFSHQPLFPSGLTNSYLMSLIAPTNSGYVFTLRLETNGTYVAKAQSDPDVRRGTWHWDAQKEEFFLVPGSFTFYIRRLPVDKLNTNRLVWGDRFLVRQESE